MTFESHDLHLPDWGPYTKQYAGVSHLPAVHDGTRFDLAVFPGLFRRRVEVPNVRFEGPWHVWQAAPDLSCYTLRYELEWKDRVYADISFLTAGEQGCLIRAELHNASPDPQDLVLHYAASAHDPTPSGQKWTMPGPRIRLPESAVLVMANDYRWLRFRVPRPADGLGWDGLRRAEQAVPGFLQGYGVGWGFGGALSRDHFGRPLPAGMGDRMCCRFALSRPLRNPCLLVRYRNEGTEDAAFSLSTGDVLTLPPCRDPRVARLDLGVALPAGDLDLVLTGHGVGHPQLDCLVLCEADQAGEVELTTREEGFRPLLGRRGTESLLTLRYPHLAGAYALGWDYENAQVRQIENDELDVFLRDTAQDHVHDLLVGNRKGHFTDVFLRPIPLAPGQTRVLWGAAAWGADPAGAAGSCRTLLGDPAARQARWEQGLAAMAPAEPLPHGRAFALGQQLMQGVLCTNVVYPVYTRRQYIRHNTPGRWWDSLYTWDSGFIGMGLAALSVRRGLDCLRAYLTTPGDEEAAFIHHGSLLPTQFFLFAELLNRPESRQDALALYPEMCHAYAYFSGQAGGSTTGNMASGLLRPWDYFYNSGGWDDYPAQKEIALRGLQRRCTPVITTAHAARYARILAYAAGVLGREEEAVRYEADAQRLARCLNTVAWDEEAGYYSYVLHNEKGEPEGFLRDEAGVNLDMGLDGAAPLFASACPPDRARRLWDKVRSPRHLWTDCGLTAVDRAAPYARTDGYWNGSVWMPYQWIFFKAALDAGDPDFALRIAHTALELWQTECARSYHCFEHFMVESGRGAGWHQFGGLSAPVIQWYASCCVPGTLTPGFDTFVAEARWDRDHTSLTARLDCTRPGPAALLVTLQPGEKRLTCSLPGARAVQRRPGLWVLTLEVPAPGPVTFTLA